MDYSIKPALSYHNTRAGIFPTATTAFKLLAFLLRGASFQLVSLRVLILVFDIDVTLGASPNIQRSKNFTKYSLVRTPVLFLVAVQDYIRPFCTTYSGQQLDTALKTEVWYDVSAIPATLQRGVEDVFQVAGQGNYVNGNCSIHVSGIVRRWVNGQQCRVILYYCVKVLCLYYNLRNT
ncbi:hypothetical protein JTE90_004090 [Oedothorax gibbosus]|uniref:Uncharacterized protein n=1 Tax=Oedothorax gibbosus TaxID=931172 RepID=A0AAV6UCU5_9ARAC|nr:hypothetical protein JTE90_004090 [Oedothorax gibbosus]